MNEDDLHRRWIKASFAIGTIGDEPFGGHVAYEIQSLGRLDVKLRSEEPELEALVTDQSSPPDNRLGEHLDLSRLWVLAGYELVRTLDACVSGVLWSPEQTLADRLKKGIKYNFTLVRIPLAKFEPAFKKGKARPGDLVAEPLFEPGQGAGWNIGGNSPFYKIITRRELADQLLEFLEDVRRTNPNLPTG